MSFYLFCIGILLVMTGHKKRVVIFFSFFLIERVVIFTFMNFNVLDLCLLFLFTSQDIWSETIPHIFGVSGELRFFFMETLAFFSKTFK